MASASMARSPGSGERTTAKSWKVSSAPRPTTASSTSTTGDTSPLSIGSQ